MNNIPLQKHLAILAALAATCGIFCGGTARADTPGPVFVIAMENHNWTQPGGNINNAPASGLEQIFNNPAAPYINSLVTPGNPNALYSSYASNYISTISPVTNSDSHPSEPNYLWSEAGTDFGVTNDNDPYAVSGGTERPAGTQHLTGLMQTAGLSWRSYQEGADLVPTSGTVNQPGSSSLTNIRAAPANFTSPITSFSGTSASYTNQYNASHQYNYAGKHDPQIYFPDTSGGNVTDSTNTEKSFYAPIEQLSNDLTAGTYAKYNWVTPDQYNDMHTSLSGGFLYHGTQYTGDAANISQGDNFLSIVIPMIEASDAFQNHNATIIIWNDETEGDTVATRSQYDSMEIVISKLAKGNAYDGTIQYTHSSDLKTMQLLFGVSASTPSGFLGDAANASDLSDLFKPGAIPNAGSSAVPEPASLGMLTLGAMGLLMRKRRRA